MKIFLNKNYEILSIDIPPASYEYVMEVDRTRKDMFGDLCDACVCGYRYEPAYEMSFHDDGSNRRDEKTGELVYKVDSDGSRIQMGWQCYPFVDVQTLYLIQRQHEASQEQLNELTVAVSDLIGGVSNA